MAQAVGKCAFLLMAGCARERAVSGESGVVKKTTSEADFGLGHRVVGRNFRTRHPRREVPRVRFDGMKARLIRRVARESAQQERGYEKSSVHSRFAIRGSRLAISY